MSAHEMADAKAAYQRGDYGKAAKELADAAKYSVEHAASEVKTAVAGKKDEAAAAPGGVTAEVHREHSGIASTAPSTGSVV